MSLDLSAMSRSYNRPERLKEVLKMKIGFCVESDENLFRILRPLYGLWFRFALRMTDVF